MDIILEMINGNRMQLGFYETTGLGYFITTKTLYRNTESDL